MYPSIQSSRRHFLQRSLGGAAAIGMGVAIPDCLARAADAQSSSTNERVLVVVQLSGGNDGLNTIVPYADDAYRAARPKLAVSSYDILKCDDDAGFHPSMQSAYELLQDGRLSVLQGVGYDHPNRSHFESMDIWHTCKRKGEPRPDGWLGRYLDSHAKESGSDVPAMHLGSEQQPFAIASTRVRVPTVSQLSEFQLLGKDRQALRSLLDGNLAAQSAPSDDLLNFLQASTTSALAASQRVSEASQDYRSEVKYPDSEFGQRLRVVAQLIDAGLKTRIYYVQLDGFDTHAQQSQTHAILLRDWSDAVSSLVRDLDAHGHAERVCVMTFSEFGRRVAENASEGTDHGAAGPMFLCGGRIKSGIIGARPSLTDLQDGDLKHQIDFRQVYASVLETWLGADSRSVLGGEFKALPLFS